MRPLGLPRDLTVPEPGSSTTKELLSRALARLLEETPPLLMEAAREARASGFGAWIAAVTREPGAAASLLRRPNVGGLVRVLRSATGEERRRLLAELVATFAFELSSVGALDAELTLGRLPPRIVAVGARRVVVIPPDVKRVTFEPAKVVADGARGLTVLSSARAENGVGPHRAAEADEPPAFTVLEAPLIFALADNNPLALMEAHPDKHGNAIDLGGKSIETWLASLRAALGRVGAFMPELREEMSQLALVVVPVGYDADRHLSASYREIVGAVYLTLHPEVVTMAEALVHEASHTKLNLLFELDPILENAGETGNDSPLRPDPRPLSGVLLAVHALLAMGRLYERTLAVGPEGLRSERFASRLGEILAGADEGLEVIEARARPTEVGRALIEEMRGWSTRLRDEARRGRGSARLA